MGNLVLIKGLLALVIGIYVIIALVIGAISLFALAGESGFMGFAVYFVCWVFLFPMMLISSIIVGILNLVAISEGREF